MLKNLLVPFFHVVFCAPAHSCFPERQFKQYTYKIMVWDKQCVTLYLMIFFYFVNYIGILSHSTLLTEHCVAPVCI